MTKQEIQALIDSKIAGQGTAVDLGGALPTILHEILEAAFAGENVQSNWNENDSESPQYIQNKPTIPAAQVNADWNANEGVAAILNKPTVLEPYFVSGITVDEETFSSTLFVVSAEEFARAKAAFLAGRTVVVGYEQGGDVSFVTGFSIVGAIGPSDEDIETLVFDGINIEEYGTIGRLTAALQ